MSEIQQVHFVVEGDFITDTARRLWNEEDEPEKAMRLLKCMNGITEAQCLEILAGKKKLIGDSSTGVTMVPDKARGKTLTEVVKKLKTERDEARDETQDLTELAFGDTVVIGSSTGARRIPRRKAKIGGLSEAMALQLQDGYEFDDQMNRPSAAGKKPFRTWQQMGESPYRDARLRQEAEHLAEEKEEKRAAAPEPTKTISTNSGWVSPEGLFYPASYGRHAFVAWTLNLTDNPQNHGVDPDGWVRVSENGDTVQFFGEHRIFSEIQKKLIRAYCKKTKIKVPYWMEEE